MHSAAPFSQTRLPALTALSRLETCLHVTHPPQLIFFFFFDFIYIPGHVTKTKTGWP